MDRSDRELIRNTLFTVAAAGALAGSFGPWLRSGASTRSSFELLDLVERLGFAPGGPFTVAIRAWPLVPLLTVVAVVACWGRRTTLAFWAGMIGALYVGGVALGVRNAPSAGLVRTGWGVDVSLVSSVVLLIGSFWLAGASRVLPQPPVDEHGSE